jgi:hypothetical protein
MDCIPNIDLIGESPSLRIVIYYELTNVLKAQGYHLGGNIRLYTSFHTPFLVIATVDNFAGYNGGSYINMKLSTKSSSLKAVSCQAKSLI